MSSNSEQERERLKEEYKDHYRRIKEAKERLKQTEQKGKIAQALNNMNADNLLESVDEFLGKVKDKVNFAEARLDVAMESLDEDDPSTTSGKLKQEELDAELKKKKAKETLQQVKAEMGMLYSEIEKHAEEIHAEKTIGTKKEEASPKKDSTTKS
ncbi:MAG: hypothetical protein RLN90_03035 [Balneolaceae bacterium]